MAQLRWVVCAVGWPTICGVAYAAWSLFRPATVSSSGWTIVFGLFVGAIVGAVIGCASFVGGTWALKIIDSTQVRAVWWAGQVAIFALITALTAGITVVVLFALSGEVLNAGRPTAQVTGYCFLISLTYGRRAIRQQEQLVAPRSSAER